MTVRAISLHGRGTLRRRSTRESRPVTGASEGIDEGRHVVVRGVDHQIEVEGHPGHAMEHDREAACDGVVDPRFVEPGE